MDISPTVVYLLMYFGIGLIGGIAGFIANSGKCSTTENSIFAFLFSIVWLPVCLGIWIVYVLGELGLVKKAE